MRAGIALGSNLGDRGAHLRAAVAAIRQFAEAPILLSRIYETLPVDCPDGSPTFLNAAIEIGYSGEAHALMQRLQAIEISLGRPTVHGRNTPRTIDLDLLYLDDLSLNDQTLILPHPRITIRSFVLLPLCDIAPERRLPGDPSSLSQYVSNLSYKDIKVSEETLS